MKPYLETLFTLPFAVVSFQFYLYSVSQKGVEKQKACRTLGIVYMALGITCLATRSAPLTFGGFVLMMLGFRLIAHGLDRIDKKVYIDSYDE